MQQEQKPSCMNQEIFKLNLSTESVSAYLLCCGLEDEGKSISTKNLGEIWTSTGSSLKQSMQELLNRKILQITVSDGEENTVYQLTDVHEWVVK